MKIIHHHNTFASDKKAVHHQMTKDFGNSNTDKSFFRPDISAARAFLGNGVGSTRVGLYDFNDGVDTGDRIQMILRDKGLDVTEVDKIGKVINNHLDMMSQQDQERYRDMLRSQTAKEILDWAKDYIKNGDKTQNPADVIKSAQQSQSSVKQ